MKQFLKDLVDQFDKLMINLMKLSAGFILLAVVALLIAWPLQLLWNECIVSMVDRTNEITIIQSIGLFLLLKIVFEMLRFKN